MLAADPGAVLARIDQAALSSAILARFRSELPGFERMSPELLEGLRATIARNMALVTGALLEGRPVEEDGLEPLWRSALERIEGGFPVEHVLLAYGLGARELWSALVAEAEAGEEAGLLAMVDFTLTYLTRIAAGVTHAYLEERTRAASERERRLSGLFAALLGPAPLSSEDAAFARTLRVPLLDAYVPFVAVLPEGDTRAHTILAGELQATAVLAVSEGARVVGLLPPDRVLAAGLPDDHLVVRGGATRRGELGPVFADLRLATGVAARAGRCGGWPLAALGPELLLARSPDVAADLRRAVLAPLEDGGRANAADLCATLETWFASGLDRAATATALLVHPNTLDRRLRRIEERTGLDLGDVADLSRLQLALLARRVEAR